ncbi:MAG: alpha/beta hydrolase family protein [Thermoleophilaceae bacterium]
MHRRLAPLIAAVFLFAAAPASAAQQLLTIETPSEHVAGGETLKANVLLPDGYEDGDTEYPVLYLLHGAGEGHASWALPAKGDILQTAKGLDAIVVMPDGGRDGFYTNWWNGGLRGDPGWERYHLDELIPLIEERFRVRDGRRWHAIAGFSMGGFGTAFYATQRPGYFGAAVPMSALVSIRRPQILLALEPIAGAPYEQVWGPITGAYAEGHDPVALVENLRHTRLYVATGTGIPRPGVPATPTALASGVVELELFLQSLEFALRARHAGAGVTFDAHLGVHDWPYWREDLRKAFRWGLFRDVAADPASWTYETVAQSGEMWGLGFEFSAAPGAVARFARAGDRLSGSGSGTVTVDGGSGCSFTAALPFERPCSG